METPFSLPKQGQIGETYIQGTSKTGEAYGQEPPSPQLSQQIPQNILGTDGTLVQEGRTPLQKSLRKYLKQLRNKPGGSRVSFSSSDSSSMTSSNEVSTRTKPEVTKSEVYSTAGCPIDLERKAFDSTLLRLVEEEGVDPEEVQAEKRESLKMLGLLQSFLTNPALSREQKAEVCSSLLTKLEALMVTPKSEYLAHLIFPTQITQITELYEWLSLTNKQTNKQTNYEEIVPIIENLEKVGPIAMNRLAQQVHDTFSGFYLERWNVANQKIIELQEAFDSSGSLILSWPSWSKLVIKISIEDSLPVLSRSPLTLQQISEWGSQLKLTPQQISEWVQLTQQQISEPKTAQKQQPDENGDSLAKATQELIESGFIMATGLAVEQASSEPKDFNLEDLLLYVKQMYEKRKHEIQKRLNTIKPKKTYFSFDKEPKEEVKLQELLHDIDRIQAAVDTAEKIIDQIDKYLEGVNAVYREFLPYHPDKSEEGIFLLACNVSGLEFHIDTAGNPVLTFPRRFQKVSSKKTM